MVYDYHVFYIYFPAKMKINSIKISASILSADLRNLSYEMHSLDRYVDEFHLDIMDGHFVPNISFGPELVKAVRKLTNKPLDIHLMIENPIKYVDMFVDAGADLITFHYETGNYFKCRDYIKSKNVKVGIAYNPNTQVYILDSDINRVLIMSVHPGFAGQKFIRSSLRRIYQARKWADKKCYNIEVAVDGGIDNDTAYQVVRNGADVMIAGSYLFKGNKQLNVLRLRNASLAGLINKKK